MHFAKVEVSYQHGIVALRGNDIIIKRHLANKENEDMYQMTGKPEGIKLVKRSSGVTGMVLHIILPLSLVQYLLLL